MSTPDDDRDEQQGPVGGPAAALSSKPVLEWTPEEWAAWIEGAKVRSDPARPVAPAVASEPVAAAPKAVTPAPPAPRAPEPSALERSAPEPAEPNEVSDGAGRLDPDETKGWSVDELAEATAGPVPPVVAPGEAVGGTRPGAVGEQVVRRPVLF